MDEGQVNINGEDVESRWTRVPNLSTEVREKRSKQCQDKYELPRRELDKSSLSIKQYHPIFSSPSDSLTYDSLEYN